MTRTNPVLRVESESRIGPSGSGQTRSGPRMSTASRPRERKLKIVVFAATGGIGQEAVAQALAAGHDVTAVVRDPKTLAAGVPFVTADLAAADTATLESAVRGADAVISCLGPRPLRDAGIAERGTRAIVAAMKSAGVRRLVVVSAAPISTVPSPGRPDPPRHDPGEGFFMRHLFEPAGEDPVPRPLRRPRADGRHRPQQRPGLDDRPAAEPEQQTPDRNLPDGVWPEHPGRILHLEG